MRIVLLSLFLSFVGCLYAQIPYTWGTVKIGGGGFVSAVLASPAEKNLIYARTDVGGAYRWDEKCRCWIPLTDWASYDQRSLLGVESLAIDPQLPNKLYLSAGLSGYGWPGASILRSNDYGASFEVIPVSFYIHGNGMGRQAGERLAVDPNSGNILFCGSRRDGLWKSTNGASTWNKVASFPVNTTPNLNAVCFVLFDKNSGIPGQATQTIYAGSMHTGENIYVSKDGGATWKALTGTPVPANLMPQRAALTPDGKFLFITYANGAGPHAQSWDGVNDPMNRGAVYRYNTTTNEWKDISPVNLMSGTTNGCYGGMDINGANGNKIVVSTINHWGQQQYYTDGSSAWGDRIFISDNAGDTWTALFSGNNAMKLDNNGISWISGHNLHWVGSLAWDPFNEKRLFATSGNGVFMTENLSSTGGTIMKFMVDGLEETVPLDMVSIPNGPFVSIVGDYDGWVHDDVLKHPGSKRHTPNMGTSSGIACSPQNTSVLVRAGSSNGALYYSTNTGQTWTVFSKLPPSTTNNGKVAVSSSGTTHLAAWIPSGASDQFFVTTNWGGSWSNLWNSSYGSIKDARPYADPVDPTVFYVYSPNKGIVYKCIYQIGGGRPEVQSLADVGTGGSPQLAINPQRSGDIWIALGTTGLKQIVDGKINQVKNINASVVTLGKTAIGNNYPTLYVWGSYSGISGLFRSTDQGSTWFRINDDQHQYGGLGNANMILADQNIFGRVYLSTAGRGIAMGNTNEVINSVVQTTLNPKNKAVRFRNNFVLNFDDKVSYSVYTLNGQLAEQGKGRQLTIGANLSKGLYLLRIVGTDIGYPQRIQKE